MKKILIDLNVLMDFLFKREDHAYAAKIIDLCVLKKVKGFVCAHEITTLSYFLFKEYKNKDKIKFAINELFQIFNILPINIEVLKRALNSQIDDYEDAVIEVSALSEKVDFIISRDLNDFKISMVKAMTPAEYLVTYFSN